MTSRKISYRTASYGFFIFLVLLILFTFSRYGISWDEGTHDRVAEYLLRYYMGFLRGKPDFTVLELGNPVAYGGVFNFLVAVAQRFSPLDRFETRHLVNALVGLLGVVGCWKLTQRIAGEKAAFWVALLLVLTPGYYGHMFFNPKDIPFAAGMTWGLYFILRIQEDYPKRSLRSLLGLGLTAGLTMGMRVGGIMLLGYLSLMLLLETAIVMRQDERVVWSHLLGRFVAPIGLVSGLAYGTMLFFWPWAQQRPLLNPYLSFLGQQQIEFVGQVLYRGNLYAGVDLPLDYLAGYLLVTLPEALLVLLLLGLLVGLAVLGSVIWGKKQLPSSWRGIGLLLLAVLVPLSYVAWSRPVLYDGTRHFIFLLPPLICLAGISFQQLEERLARRSRLTWQVFQVSLVGLLLVQAVTMARLFPYEYVDYNMLTGGVQGAEGQYELDYWGVATSEAARWLADYAAERGAGTGRRYPVYTCAGKASAAYYYNAYLKVVPEPERAHFAILINRSGCDLELPGETLFTVERLGVPLAVVKELY